MDSGIREKSPAVSVSREYGSDRLGQRHVLLLLTFSGMLLMYSTRIALSISMVAMTVPIVQNPTNLSNSSLQDVCPFPNDAREVSEVSDSESQWNTSEDSSATTPRPLTARAKTFDWDSETQGYLHGGFLYGYLLAQLPGGWIAHRMGAKWPLAISMLVTAVMTLLSPIAASTSVWLFLTVRVVVGMVQGIIWSTMGGLWGKWAPPLERGRLLSVTYSGAHIGTVFGMCVAGDLAQRYDWRAIFYCFGAICLVWVLLWTLLAHNTPQSHPRISKEERDYILTAINPDNDPSRKQLLGSQADKNREVPWKSILTSFPVWVILTVEFCNQGSFFTLIFYLPTYLNNIHHFSIKSNGSLSALPYLLCWVVTLSAGRIADFVLTRKYCSATTLRKIMSCGAFATCGSCLVGVAFSGCSSTIAVTCFIIGIGFNGGALVGHVVAYSDMSPNYSSILMGMGNGVGVVSGIIATYVVGALTEAEGGRSIAGWQMVFLIAGGMLGLASLLFAIFGTAKRQSWDRPSL
ncbi:hypothetical protein RvY_16506 [Ramazzottius varieornatus]|uniref:Major facilitator superfamily (MFS) profile domain-containing protein n=1 Tax=Ramazzottius varieornatus TaxID=947166 RepID=A0A1D1VYQ6_RAMVA|nr:hypothetical protein RvY_16506 [Ramazzottius varieornatus]